MCRSQSPTFTINRAKKLVSELRKLACEAGAIRPHT